MLTFSSILPLEVGVIKSTSFSNKTKMIDYGFVGEVSGRLFVVLGNNVHKGLPVRVCLSNTRLLQH